MQKENYVPNSASVSVSQGIEPVRMTLTPDFGWVTVSSSPSGLPVFVDGERVGLTPLSNHELSTGPHQVLVSDARYCDSGKQVRVDRGETETISVEPQPREGGLVVSARDKEGNDLEAEVWLDGVRIGIAPLAKQVLMGRRKLEVVESGRRVERFVDVKEKQVEEVAVEFKEMPRKAGPSGGAGTWTDPDSGHTWQMKPTGGTMSWSDAKAHCRNLSLEGEGWRLPAIDELRSLIRGCVATQSGGRCNVAPARCLSWSCGDDSCVGCYTGEGPGDAGLYWPNAIAGECCSYWSSSLGAGGDHAWGVHFDNGSLYINDVSLDDRVRCVR